MSNINDYEGFDTPAAPPPAPGPSGGYEMVGGKPRISISKPSEPLTINDYEGFDSGDQPGKQQPAYREVGPGQAAVHGYVDLMGMGLVPGIAGAAEAGRAPGGTGTGAAMTGVASEAPGMEDVGEGIARLWHDHFGNHPDPAARAAYNEGSQRVLNDQKLAKDQHFWPYLAGQVSAALTFPAARSAMGLFMGAKAAPALISGLIGQGATRQIAGTALTAGTQTAAHEAGAALSEGRPEDIPLEAAEGFASGASLGTLLHGAVGGVGALGGKVATIVRGAQAPDAQAGRKIVEALGADISRFGPSMTPEEQAAAKAAGTPTALIDVGGEQTRKLWRSGANLSPEGRQVAERFTQRRFRQQGSRVANFIRDLMGGADKTRDQDVIDAAKAAFNKPAYQRAYQAGDRPIMPNEALLGDPDMIEAIGKAARTGKSWAIFDGLGAFNPGVTITEDGRLIFNRGPTGVPTYPNIQFWDYVARELKGMGDATRNSADQMRIRSLRRDLLKDLDAQVPEYGTARQTASNFFGAENAVEAGENFVMMPGRDLGPARRALASMKPAEREIFARSFASDLASKFEDIRNNNDVINAAFVDSPTASAKIRLALGNDRANQLEALLRAENVVDQARDALRNSTTARQLHELGAAGTAVGAAEGIKHTGGLTGIIMAGLGIKAGASKLHAIDEKVAQRVVEMLASDDYSQVLKAIQVMSKSPTWMNVLRTATGATARVGATDIGFPNLAAGGLLAAEDIGGMFRKEHEKQEPHHETENKQYHQYEDATQ